MVFFDFISNQTWPWHQTFLNEAKERWGDKFLGIHLYDEPGGQQIEFGQWDNGTHVRGLYSNVKAPSEAVEAYMQLGRTQSMNEIKSWISLSLLLILRFIGTTTRQVMTAFLWSTGGMPVEYSRQLCVEEPRLALVKIGAL